MYRIAVLAEKENEGHKYTKHLKQLCERKGMFPRIIKYNNQESFFANLLLDAPTHALIAFSGITGLNTAERLHSLCPACRIIWFCDQDFSLHAFRLRADYFMLKPISDEELEEGLSAWFGQDGSRPLKA